MTTKQIDYCIELARTLNFSRAAENAFVSQPTFSYQVKLLEDEVGFKIFERNGKGAALTPAGQQFVTYLSGMREDMKRAIEQGQNFSARYTDNITVSMMVRQAIYFLPEAIRIFEKEQPGVQVTPLFQYDNGVESFLKDESDVLFALIEQTKHIPGINVHKLFDSGIYLIVHKNDPLAKKKSIRVDDLIGLPLFCSGQGWEKDIPRWAKEKMDQLHLEGSFRLSYNASLFAKEHLGYLLTFDRLVDTSSESGLVFRRLTPILETKLFIVWKRYQMFSPIADRFLRRIQASFSAT